MAAPILEATAVTHFFGLTPVLHDLDFSIGAGRAAAIVGRNGTGKSTLIRLFAGLLRPTGGSVRVFCDTSPRFSGPTRRRLGLMTHQSLLYPNLTARENLEFYGRLYSVRDPRHAAARLLDRVGLSDQAEKRARELSRGMLQKLSLARAMVGEPDLILCDEPLASIDSDSVAIAASIFTDALNRGCAIVLTAHDRLSLAGIELELWELASGGLGSIESGSPHRLRKAQA
jgi:heme ABC exporter ATP-binding subunit CcmA